MVLAAAPLPFFALFAFGLIVLVVFLGHQHNKRTNAAWSTFARLSGLDYARSGGLSGKRKLRGEFRGYRVQVNTFTESSGKNSSTYTRYQLWYPSLGLGLELKRQHLFATLTRALTGGQDIEVGAEDFDRNVIVKARSPRAVAAFLTDERRLRIERFLVGQRRATVTDDCASFVVHRAESDAGKLQQGLELLARLADSFAQPGSPAAAPAPPDVPATARPSAPEPPPLAAALEARKHGDLERALELVGTTREADAGDVDAAVVESEIHEAAGDLGRAAASLDSVEQAHADDEALAAARASLARRLEQARSIGALGSAPGAPAVSSAPGDAAAPDDTGRGAQSTAATPGAPPAPAPASTPSTGTADYRELRAVLFEESRMSFETAELFAERFAERPVRWIGRLERVSSFSSDLVFRGGAGHKAIVALEPIGEGYLAKAVQAVVRLDDAGAQAAKGLEGQQVTLTGRLLSCDGFMRNLFLEAGALEPAG